MIGLWLSGSEHKLRNLRRVIIALLVRALLLVHTPISLMKARLDPSSILQLALLYVYLLSTTGLRESCCKFKEDANQVFQCVAEGRRLHEERGVLIISFTTPSTLKYASYSLAINAHYANKHGYSFKVFDLSETGQNGDPRWNKIYLLWDSLQHWGRDFAYIVWLDSDLAIIDHSLDVKHVAMKYPHAHVVMSRDIPSAPFVSNSGVIIVKNTEWSVGLMKLWWSSYDRDKCCDQNAFTWLYDRPLPLDIREKVALLPASAINTHFPAWLHQKETDPVLHLAGLSTLYRETVFRAGFQALCAAEAAGVAPPPQLTLDRVYLFDVMRRMSAARKEACDHLISRVKALESSSSASIEAVLAVRGRLLDALKADDDEKNHFTRQDFPLLQSIQVMEYTLKHWIAAKLIHFAKAKLDAALTHGEVQDAVGAVFELCVTAQAHGAAVFGEVNGQGQLSSITRAGQVPDALSPSVVALLGDCAAILDSVLATDNLPAAVRGSLLYFRFKNYHFLAVNSPVESAAASNHTSQRMEYLRMAAVSWKERRQLNSFDAQYVLADPEKEYVTVVSELALLYCLQNNHHSGLALYAESIALQQQTILGLGSIKIATREVAWSATTTLLDTAINAALCWAGSNGTIDPLFTLTIVRVLTELTLNEELRRVEPKKYDTASELKTYISSHSSVKRLKRKEIVAKKDSTRH